MNIWISHDLSTLLQEKCAHSMPTGLLKNMFTFKNVFMCGKILIWPLRVKWIKIIFNLIEENKNGQIITTFNNVDESPKHNIEWNNSKTLKINL